MPIYAYKCTACGHQQDVLQKLSDDPLTHCTACGAAAFSKQLTAAGFQLKGSGWYVTDFKNGSKPATDAKPADAAAKPADGQGAAAKPAEAKGAETKSTETKPAEARSDKPAPAAATKPAAPAAGS